MWSLSDLVNAAIDMNARAIYDGGKRACILLSMNAFYTILMLMKERKRRVIYHPKIQGNLN